MLRWTRESVGEQLVDVVLSLNEKAKERHGQEVATASYSHVQPSLAAFDEIGRAIEELDGELAEVCGHAGTYLRSMNKSFRYFLRSLQGDAVPYRELLGAIQELPADCVTDEQIRYQQEQAEQCLAALGYRGSWREQVLAWKADTLLKPEEVVPTAASFVARSKIDTQQHVITLPADDEITSVSPIQGVFWSGYSKYTGGHKGTLTFNIDRPWTEPILAQILCHEAYPGHQAFYCRWDHLYEQGKLPLEASYYLINSPTNALFEGGPETALHFLGWDEEETDTPGITQEQKRQYKAARAYLDWQRMHTTNACMRYNLGEAGKEELIAGLQEQALLSEVEANNSFRFFSDPIQRTYFPSYYYGKWMVWNAYEATGPAQRAQFFKELYDTPHTTNTLIAAVGEMIGKPFDAFATR